MILRKSFPTEARLAGALLGLAVAGMSLTPSPADAGIITYSDQATFLAHVQPGYYLETFNSLAAGQLTSPQTFSGSGFGYEASAPDGLYGQTLGVDRALGAFGGSPTITISSLTGAPTAIGGFFFMSDGVDGINSLGAMSVTATDGIISETVPLAAPTSGTTFVGFISDAGPFTGLTFVRTSGSGTGFRTTNDFIVGNAIPEPSTLALYGWAGLIGLGYARRRCQSK